MLLIVTATQKQMLLLETEEKFLYLKGDPLGCTQYNDSRKILISISRLKWCKDVVGLP